MCILSNMGLLHGDRSTCVSLSQHSLLCAASVEGTMHYIYIVLLNTALAAIIVYLLQLQFSLWGRNKREVDRKSEMKKNGKNVEKILRKKSDTVDKEKELKGEKHEDKDDQSVKKDEKLEIRIVTNKKPIIERISPEEKEEETSIVKCNPLNFCQFLQKWRNSNKVQVNIPLSDWKGKVNCKIFKKVDFQSQTKTHSQRGKGLFVDF